MDKSNRESSKTQRQLIGMACSHFRIGKTDKKVMLLERYGKGSASDLSFADAEELIDDFVAKGFVIKSNKRRYLSRRRPVPGSRKSGPGEVVPMATQAELAKIDALANLIEWRVENGMSKWMNRRFRIRQVKTSYEAFKVIEGLKGMFENQMKKRFGKEWWQLAHDDIEVCWYIAEYYPMMVDGNVVPAYARVRDMGGAGSLTGAL